MARKIKIIVSDFHIGKGKFLPDGRFNQLEDFFYDDRFIEFLEYHRTGEFAEAEVELICNGDFFNHLQTDPDDPHPDIITEVVALRRMGEILDGHPALFQALRDFNHAAGHSVTFILGNHDPGLLFSKVQELLRTRLGPATRVVIGAYLFDKVHVEHGNQYFADNAYDPRRYFLTEGLAEPVVNLPWGSFFVIHVVNRVKQERAYFDKIYPFSYYFRWAFFHDTWFALRTFARLIFYFCGIRFRRNQYRRSSFLRTLKILKEVPMTPHLDRYAKRILLTRPVRIVVFGHTHYAMRRQFGPDQYYLNTGVWNEQISLDLAKLGNQVSLTYVQLDYQEGVPHPLLKVWRGRYQMVEELF